MMETKSIKRTVSVLMLIAINFAFTYKYALRYTDLALIIAVSVASFQWALFKSKRLAMVISSWQPALYVLVVLGIVSLTAIASFYIELGSLQVDRHSVISSFVDAFLSGQYPYEARSHLGNLPGPMPVYFLIAAPFYYTGTLCLLSGLGYLIVAGQMRNSQHCAALLLFLASSPVLYWEIGVRSNVFTFSLLSLMALELFSSMLKKPKVSIYWSAVLCGLILSTRSVSVLALVVYFLSAFLLKEVNFKQIVSYGVVMTLTFLATFIPFIIGYGDAFWRINPFIVQSTFLLPSYYNIGFIAIAIGLSFLVRSNVDRLFYSGLSLFIAIVIYSLYHLSNFGIRAAFFESSIDISYFIFCMPFFIMFLSRGHETRAVKTI